MNEKRSWLGATGVVPPGIITVKLRDAEWEHAQTVVRTLLGRSPPAEFREALDHALQARQAADYLQKMGSPKQVRYNLKRAIEAALRLNDRLNDLDGKSRQLLGE